MKIISGSFKQKDFYDNNSKKEEKKFLLTHKTQYPTLLNKAKF